MPSGNARWLRACGSCVLSIAAGKPRPLAPPQPERDPALIDGWKLVFFELSLRFQLAAESQMLDVQILLVQQVIVDK